MPVPHGSEKCKSKSKWNLCVPFCVGCLYLWSGQSWDVFFFSASFSMWVTFVVLALYNVWELWENKHSLGNTLVFQIVLHVHHFVLMWSSGYTSLICYAKSRGFKPSSGYIFFTCYSVCLVVMTISTGNYKFYQNCKNNSTRFFGQLKKKLTNPVHHMYHNITLAVNRKSILNQSFIFLIQAFIWYWYFFKYAMLHRCMFFFYKLFRRLLCRYYA